MNDQRNHLQTWQIAGLNGGEGTEIRAYAGKSTVIVGANGAGKSALGWKLEQGGNSTLRVLAHRKLWFDAPGPDITSSQRQQTVANIKSWDSDPSSRYLDHGNQQRAAIVLFDLLALYNTENAQIANKVRAGEQVTDAKAMQSVLDRLNSIFAGAALPLTFSLTANGTIEAQHSVRLATYPISQMSDGEKSALLLSAEILSSPPGTTFIIDEPERHLHRSISAGLVAALMADRVDAHFVVLTHDLDLAASLPEASADKYVLSNCSWQNGSVTGWELYWVSGYGLPDDVRRAVLGGRRQLLFLEGQSESLDNGLYSVLYPGLTLSPVGSCDQVIRAVAGVRDSSAHHWLEAAGIIDSDGREAEEAATLAARGVLVLPVSEIESLFYVEPVMRAVAERQAESLGLPADDFYDRTITAALGALGQGDAAERLSVSVAEKRIHRKATAALPGRHAIAASGTSIKLEVESPYASLMHEYRSLLAQADFAGLLKQFSIRDTSARDVIAATMRFRSFADYEAAVLVRLRSDATLASGLRTFIGALPAASSGMSTTQSQPMNDTPGSASA